MPDPTLSVWNRAWNRWLRIAGVIGDFQARVILSLFYFVIVLPFGLAVRLFADPLKIKGQPDTTWSDFVPRAQTIDEARKQY
jgi:hypothetical protein